MALLHWKPHFSVGVAAVDHEHKELIDLINQLHADWCANRASVATEAFFGDLLRGISAHFALEERFMREHRYDQLLEHKGDHERLLDELRDIMEIVVADPNGGDALSERLEAWFARHFETHDARLHQALGSHDG